MPEEVLLSALRGLVPAGLGCGCADPGRDHALLPGEALPHALPARLREFAAGRAAARAAMAEIGLPPVAVPQGADRAPVWPVGVVGSITHTAGACLAVVGLSHGFAGLGLDLEEATPLPRDLWDTILLPDEQMALMRLAPEARGLAAKVAFSAKEAAYKAQYPVSQTLFGFEQMTVAVEQAGFVARFAGPIAPFAAGAEIAGRLTHAAGHVLTLALLPKGEGDDRAK